MPLRRGDEGGPGSSLRRNPVRPQSPRDHGADQRGAKTRLLQREGKLLRHLGGNLEADPKNQRRRKRSTFPRSHLKRSSEDGSTDSTSQFNFPISCQVLGRRKEQRILIPSLLPPASPMFSQLR